MSADQRVEIARDYLPVVLAEDRASAWQEVACVALAGKGLRAAGFPATRRREQPQLSATLAPPVAAPWPAASFRFP